ncbi:hypothetical protein CT0861_08698 [Colletotrichum tofieldiae]|uniref:Uncharacterized protein n=1 Tax=Colletotrichum tofieldiae TaxID=708197 RepID=A0A166S3Q1_9PEZI|nr:hypothetical protein CT0861_08698 [Colletotrichum tofieldiae]
MNQGRPTSFQQTTMGQPYSSQGPNNNAYEDVGSQNPRQIKAAPRGVGEIQYVADSVKLGIGMTSIGGFMGTGGMYLKRWARSPLGQGHGSNKGYRIRLIRHHEVTGRYIAVPRQVGPVFPGSSTWQNVGY